jgi:Sulfatase
VLLADDLGIGEVGAYGQRELLTPHIDRLARDGMRFTSFRSSAAVCGPARCSFMTGYHTGRCRLDDNDNDYLRRDDLTLAERFKGAGYATALVGKWGLSWESEPESWPQAQGFDTFFGYRDQVHAHNFFPEYILSGTDSLRLPNVVPSPLPHHQPAAHPQRDARRRARRRLRGHGPGSVCARGVVAAQEELRGAGLPARSGVGRIARVAGVAAARRPHHRDLPVRQWRDLPARSHAGKHGHDRRLDIERDPGERTDRRASEPAVAARLDSIRVREDQRVAHPARRR